MAEGETTGIVLDGNDPAAIARAAGLLADGELVAFPTETVYGLGARADEDEAVARIFAAKGRPPDHPLIVHVCDAASALPFARRMPAVAQRLMAAFWPGPLTLIVPRAAGMGAAAAAGQDSIGLRCPAHPVALALLREAQRLGVAGVAAPSANRFGKVSPTRALHVTAEFGNAVLVLDGGDSALGIESTIIDCTRDRMVLLRPGVLTVGAIEAAAGEPLHRRDAEAPRASGTLASHYAPRARVRLLSPHDMREALHRFERGVQAPLQSPDNALAEKRSPTSVALYSRTVRPGVDVDVESAVDAGIVSVRMMPNDPGAVAHELFAVLRALDDEGVTDIWVEEPPHGSDWDGVRDRLQRAAA